MFKKKSPVRTKQPPKRRIRDPRQLMILRQTMIGFGIFCLLALLLTGVWYGTRLPFLTITDINVAGGETISHQIVKEKAEAELVGLYLGFIPKRFAWFYPEQKVYNAVANVSRVKDPVVERVSSTELQITFDEYIPAALWCMEGSQDCLLVDAAGYAFAPAPKLKGGALLRYYTLGREPAIGQTFVTQNELTTMNSFVELADSQADLAINSVEIDAVKDVYYQLSGGGEIKATLTMTPSVAISNLLAVLSAPEFSNLGPGNFQYIDLRFGSKVFVNDSVLEETAATTTAAEDTER